MKNESNNNRIDFSKVKRNFEDEAGKLLFRNGAVIIICPKCRCVLRIMDYHAACKSVRVLCPCGHSFDVDALAVSWTK